MHIPANMFQSKNIMQIYLYVRVFYLYYFLILFLFIIFCLLFFLNIILSSI